MCDLGRAGAQCGRPLAVFGRQKAAADWLVSQQVANYNGVGQLVLHSASLVFKTCLSNPTRVREPDVTSERSLWSLRRQLSNTGWESVTSARTASVSLKRFNTCNTSSTYLAILLDRTLTKL